MKTTLELLKEIKSLSAKATVASEEMFVYGSTFPEAASRAEARFKKLMTKKIEKLNELMDRITSEDDEVLIAYLNRGGCHEFSQTIN